MSTDTQNNAPVIAEAFSIPAALREIASWMDSGGPTYHEAELIGMNIAGPTGCGAHKECTKAAKLAFLEAARIWERLHPGSPVSAEPLGMSLEIRTLGNYGAAFDSPGNRRAYTYDHQPGNVKASRLGSACLQAAAASAGDTIDRGLGLLKELQAQGFGVFDTDSARWHAAPVAAQSDLTQQTLDDVMAGIPARDAEIEALRKQVETLQAQLVDRSPEMQGTPVDESPNLQSQQQPVSGADQFRDTAQMIEPSGNSGELPSDDWLTGCVGVHNHGGMHQITGLADIRRFTECVLKHWGKQDADKVDAERYRAWRDAACKNDRTLIDAMFEYQQKHFRGGNPTPDQFDAGIDYALAAIDAARKEQA